MKRRLLSLLIVFAMVLSMVPTVFAEESVNIQSNPIDVNGDGESVMSLWERPMLTDMVCVAIFR